MPGDPVGLLVQRDAHVRHLGPGQHPQPYGARAAGARPTHTVHGAGDAHRHGGLRAQVAGGGLAQGGQVARRELDGFGEGAAALGHARGRCPADGYPGALGAPDQGDQGLGQLVADPRRDCRVEGLRATRGPPVVDGLTGGVQGLVQAYGQRTAGADRQERREVAAIGGGAHQDALQGGLGGAPVPGAVVGRHARAWRAPRRAACGGRRRAAAPPPSRSPWRRAPSACRVPSGSRRWGRRGRAGSRGRRACRCGTGRAAPRRAGRRCRGRRG